MSGSTALVARLDSAGDVLISGPAVRAVAAVHDRVVFLAGPRGRAAAELLPGVDEVLEWQAPWVDFDSPPLTSDHVESLVKQIVDLGAERALIFTSFHQSPLPLALLLRMAEIPWVAAISDDYPGRLLDLRHRVDAHLPEPLRALSLAQAAAYRLPVGDDGRLHVNPQPLPDPLFRRIGGDPYLVFHPGAAVPARQPDAAHSGGLVAALAAAGHRVVVTGGPDERGLTAAVAGAHAADLGGRTTLAELAAVMAGAQAVVAPNTGPAHLSAAVGTPVVSLFAPVVAAGNWTPYGVPVVLLGDQQAPCRLSRARTCPVPGHPCLHGITGPDVVAAVGQLLEGGRR
jgi:ADP-heptose:LPS heptosyltransferase